LEKSIIEIKNLSKSYGKVVAVKDLSFRVKEGELFAFLGENGAGKSTTINILCGMMPRDAGKVLIDGVSIDEKCDDIKRSIGVVFQSSMLDSSLSVYDNLKSRGALYGIFGDRLRGRIAKLTELFDLGEILKRQVSKLSGGQRRRADIARALIHEPRILILDEPTTGLDPKTRVNLWRVLSELRKNEKMTVLLTTHYMEEAADADYVVIIDSGRITAEGTPLELKNTYSRDHLRIYGISEEQIGLLGVRYTTLRDGFDITVPDTAEVTKMILKHPDLFADYEVTKGRMDDVFLAVTGKTLSGGDDK